MTGRGYQPVMADAKSEEWAYYLGFDHGLVWGSTIYENPFEKGTDHWRVWRKGFRTAGGRSGRYLSQ